MTAMPHRVCEPKLLTLRTLGCEVRLVISGDRADSSHPGFIRTPSHRHNAHAPYRTVVTLDQVIDTGG